MSESTNNTLSFMEWKESTNNVFTNEDTAMKLYGDYLYDRDQRDPDGCPF